MKQNLAIASVYTLLLFHHNWAGQIKSSGSTTSRLTQESHIIDLPKPLELSQKIAHAITTHDHVTLRNITDTLATVDFRMPTSDKDQQTPLYLACSIDNAPAVRILLEKTDNVDMRSIVHYTPGAPALFTPLLIASMLESESVVPLLLTAGANPNHQDGTFAFLPLVFAVEQGNMQIFDQLLKHGADATLHTQRGVTPLSAAVNNNNRGMLKKLLASEALTTINATLFDTGDTPLITATENLNLEPLQLLLAAGADPLIQNKNGETALDIAKKLDPKDHNPEMIKTIIALLEKYIASIPLEEKLDRGYIPVE
jgi:hypothetical protein